jgi:hypothetical protein
MRLLNASVLIGALIFAAAAAPTPEVETRTFTGIGSVGYSSTLELYLLEGTYRHRLTGSTACYTAASVFPARLPNGVPLSDVLSADLSVGTTKNSSSRINPTGSMTISQAGWANLQVGTGTDCEWGYAITGQFLPEGEEPVPASERSQWWLPVSGLLVVVGLLALAWRRRSAEPPADDEPIRVLDGSPTKSG